jgi:hypothetical protein
VDSDFLTHAVLQAAIAGACFAVLQLSPPRVRTSFFAVFAAVFVASIVMQLVV